MNELYHHGIKGQKWGVRRYQNPDGTRTELGKHRRNYQRASKKFDKMQEEGSTKWRKPSQVRANVSADSGLVFGSDKDVYKQGKQVNRFTSNKNEPLGSKRKYASIFRYDVKAYEEDARNGNLSNKGNDIYLDMYKTKKDLNIAHAKTVSEYLMNKYGTVQMKDRYKIYDDLGIADNRSVLEIMQQSKSKSMKASYDYLLGIYHKTGKDFNNMLVKDKTIQKECFNYFKSKGYDALVDPEDTAYGYVYPLIILNPKESLIKDKQLKVR